MGGAALAATMVGFAAFFCPVLESVLRVSLKRMAGQQGFQGGDDESYPGIQLTTVRKAGDFLALTSSQREPCSPPSLLRASWTSPPYQKCRDSLPHTTEPPTATYIPYADLLAMAGGAVGKPSAGGCSQGEPEPPPRCVLSLTVNSLDRSIVLCKATHGTERSERFVEWLVDGATRDAASCSSADNLVYDALH